jgi:hypothetical protein
MKNGPWQFDFNVVLLKEYDCSIRPSDMVFDSLDMWVRVRDLSMDMMNKVFGKLIGNWVGKYISTDVDDEGIAWGKDLRIRVSVRIDQPLMRGVSLRESEEEVEGKWFELKYEKIPHFCFECGRLVHTEDGCQAEKEEVPQWGEWLRASPGRSQKPAPPARPSFSSGSYTSRSSDSEFRYRGDVSIRDIPPRRNLARDFSYSSSSRTGDVESGRESGGVTSPMKGNRMWPYDKQDGKEPMIEASRKSKGGTFTRRPRGQGLNQAMDVTSVPQGALSRKRGTKLAWVPVPVQVIGEGSSESAGKRQRTASVFDRLEDPSADPAGQGRRAQ